MPRPLMQHGVGQLEDMFGNCRGSLQVLQQLENELQYRQVPRALALLEKVQAALAAGTDTSRDSTSQAPANSSLPAAAPPQQPDLWGQASAPAIATVAPAPVVAAAPPRVAPRPTSSIKSVDAPAAAKPAAPTAPTMPVEDAYKLLKATASSTWESIEQTRRQLVQQAHPSRLNSMCAERRVQQLSEARRVNEAYAILSTKRTGGT